MELGYLISQKRKDKNLTQLELANLLGVSDKTISKWETNRGLPDTILLPQLAKVLDVSIEEIFACISNKETTVRKEKHDKKTKEKLIKMIVVNAFCGLLLLLLFGKFVLFSDSFLGNPFTIFLSGYNVLFDMNTKNYIGFTFITSSWVSFLCIFVLALFNTVDFFDEGILNYKLKYRLLAIIHVAASSLAFISTLLIRELNPTTLIIVNTLIIYLGYIAMGIYSKKRKIQN